MTCSRPLGAGLYCNQSTQNTTVRCLRCWLRIRNIKAFRRFVIPVSKECSQGLISVQRRFLKPQFEQGFHPEGVSYLMPLATPTAIDGWSTNHATARSAAIATDKQESPRSSNSKSPTLIGQSPVMRKLFSVIERVAPTDASVLITGATGTGKELAARAIHDHEPATRSRFRRYQLLRHSRNTDRSRTLRTPARHLHRRAREPQWSL